MSVTLYLPYPPSVNTYWRANGKRRFISKAGVEFKKAVADYVISNQVPKFGDSRLRIDIIINPRSRRAFDLDNTCKAIFDSMMDAGVYDDDSQIDEFTIRRGVAKTGGGCIVVVEKIGE